MYCRSCDYTREVILNHHSDRANCPICHGPLEKAATGFNISTSKTKKSDESSDDIPREISTPLGRFKLAKTWDFSLTEHLGLKISRYDKKDPALGDPEMN